MKTRMKIINVMITAKFADFIMRAVAPHVV